MINKKEIALKALTLALTVSLAGTSIAMGNPLIANAAEPATTVSQEVQKWTPATPYIGMQLGRTWGDWDYNTSEVQGKAPLGYLSTIHTEWLSDSRFVLVQERAMTGSGTELFSMFLKPIGMEYMAQISSGILHLDSLDVKTATKNLDIYDVGFCDPGDTLWTYMQDLLVWTVGNVSATEIGNTTMDVYEDEVYQRLTVNVTGLTPATGQVFKGYVTFVWNKQVNKITGFKYLERADVYDDNRALTVTYSYLPIY